MKQFHLQMMEAKLTPYGKYDVKRRIVATSVEDCVEIAIL